MLSNKTAITTLSDNDIKTCLLMWREWASTDCHKPNFTRVRYGNHTTSVARLIPNASDNVISNVNCMDIDGAVSKMPKKMRKAIKLKYLFGFADQEAAQVLGIFLNEFDTYMHHCRYWLIKNLSL